jgi:hypothetical protein
MTRFHLLVMSSFCFPKEQKPYYVGPFLSWHNIFKVSDKRNWKVSVNLLNKQLQKAGNRWSTSLVGEVDKHSRKKFEL